MATVLLDPWRTGEVERIRAETTGYLTLKRELLVRKTLHQLGVQSTYHSTP
jgi:hypothetical protein